MNAKRKGARGEHRCIKQLEAVGYCCTRAGGSLGVFDVIAIGATDVKAIQVKCGTGNYVSAVEREHLTLLTVPASVSKEIWRYPDRCKAPLIERL